MALALSLLFDTDASLAVRGVWSALAEAGVSSDMRDLGYPPHVTLLITDDERLADRLSDGLAALAPLVPNSLTLRDVRQFPDTPVVWIECLGDLEKLHEAAAGLVPLESIRPHYRPGAWTPHVTLQTLGDPVRAIDFASDNWTPGITAHPFQLELASFVPVVPLTGVDVGFAAVRACGHLDVGDGNTIWWEEAGNPHGIPALILHGGPGSGLSAGMRRFFDPRRYRIVTYDQRGCGKSTPHASEDRIDMSVNSTAHLVKDIERLRTHLGVEAWVIYGGSWGSTLGLAYAEAFPERVRGMVIGGVTTTRRSEIDWLYRGLAPLFPVEWERFRAGVPTGTPETEMVEAYNDLLFDPDPAVREKAAADFDDWDNASVSVTPGPRPARDPRHVLARSRIVTHFFRHAAWLEEGELLKNAKRLAGIPGVLIQGRLDLQGPLVTAWELSKAWPGVELQVIENAGHSTSDAGMGEAIVAALDRIAQRMAS
jgi:proline iminopeptidase